MSKIPVSMPVSMPVELTNLRESLRIIDFFNKTATEKRINQVIKEKIEKESLKYGTPEIFEKEILNTQNFIANSNPYDFSLYKSADEEITRKNYNRSINILDRIIERRKKYVFESILYDQLYEEASKEYLKIKKIAIAKLTLASNLKYIDTLLKNTTTSGDAFASRRYFMKTNLLEEICEDIHFFYKNLKKIIPISDKNWDRYKKLLDNPPVEKDKVIGTDTDLDEIIEYENELRTLRKKLDYSPINTRQMFSTKGFQPLMEIAHTTKINLIKGFITDVQRNLFPDWIAEYKKEKKLRQIKKSNERRKEKRKLGKEDNETRIKKYFNINPKSSIKDCAAALGLNRKTVSGYKKKLGI
jgi:hypothetical protein